MTDNVQKVTDLADKSLLAEGRIIYGFGQQFGEIDPYATRLAKKFLGKSFSGPHLIWCAELVDELKSYDIGSVSYTHLRAHET